VLDVPPVDSDRRDGQHREHDGTRTRAADRAAISRRARQTPTA
jgi:hypothetical protein